MYHIRYLPDYQSSWNSRHNNLESSWYKHGLKMVPLRLGKPDNLLFTYLVVGIHHGYLPPGPLVLVHVVNKIPEGWGPLLPKLLFYRFLNKIVKRNNRHWQGQFNRGRIICKQASPHNTWPILQCGVMKQLSTIVAVQTLSRWYWDWQWNWIMNIVLTEIFPTWSFNYV